MKKIKIIYGLEAVGGGALKHVVYLVSKMNREVFEITVVLSSSRKENSEIDLQKLKDIGVKLIFLPMSRNVNVIKDIYVAIKIVKILRKEKYDIIHAHSSKAGGLFRLAACFCRTSPVYYTPHCFYFQGMTGWKKHLSVFAERILAKITTGIIVSNSERKEIIKNRITTESKIININNAIDFNEYKQHIKVDEAYRQYGIPANSFVVGAIGRLVPQKDWATYIYAAKEVLLKHPETVFIITGDGKQKSGIKKLIRELHMDNRIILTGYIHDVNKLYAIIDVLVNTSMWEGLPYVFLEAMKYKKPIIATDTGNDDVIVNEKSGYITPIKDFHSIAGKIITLIEDKQTAVRMGELGNKILTQKYSFERFIQQHELLYKKAYFKNMYN